MEKLSNHLESEHLSGTIEKNAEELQSKLVRYLECCARDKSVDFTKVKELVDNNTELFRLSKTPEFKKRLSFFVYQTSEFVSQAKEALSYTDADIEDVIFEGVTQYKHSIRKNLESAKNKFGLSQKFEERVTDESIVQSLTDHNYYLSLEYNIKQLSALGDKERIENIIKTAIRRSAQSDNCVSMGGWFVNVHTKLVTVFDVDSFVKSPEMKAVSLERVRRHLIEGNLRAIEDWMKFSNLSARDVKELEETEHYLDTLFYAELPPKPEKGNDPFWGFRDTRTNLYKLEEVKKLFDLPNDYYDTDVFREEIRAYFITNGRIFDNIVNNNAGLTLQKYHLRREDYDNPDFKQKIIELVCDLIKYSDDTQFSIVQKILGVFDVIKLSDSEFRQPLMDLIGVMTQQQYIQNRLPKIEALMGLLGMSREEKEKWGIKLCVNDIKSSSRGSALETIQKVFGVTLDPRSPEYISAAQEALVESLKNNDLRGIGGLHFSVEFLARPEIRDLASKAIVLCIQKSYWDSVKELKTLFGFDDDTIIEVALKYINHEQITPDLVNENQDEGDEEDEEWISDFILSLQSVAPTLTAEHIHKANPKLQKYAEALQNKFPFITKEKSQSLEFTIFLIETVDTSSEVFSALEKAPFLANAMEGNPRFAIKLLRQYPKLDNLSQENIAFLFNAMAEIKSAGISDELAFAEVNKKLTGYKSNSKVIEAYEIEGLDMDSWLNFPNETEFNLGEGDESVSAVALSENFERLKNSYKKYLNNIKERLEEYKDELVAKRLPSLDYAELDSKINEMTANLEKMRLMPTEWKDKNGKSRDKVIFGIEKGLENLIKQKANDKGVSVWLKVTSEFSKVEQRLDNFSVTFEELKREENVLKKLGELSTEEQKGFPVFDIAFKDLEKKGKLPDSLKGSSEEEVKLSSEKNPYVKFFAQKAKVNELKKTCRESLEQFTKSFDSLTEWLARDLSQLLGRERYSAIVQESKQNLGLDNDHMEADTRTLKMFFSDRKEGTFDGRPMRISLWKRDPDVDLYLGNYTDCCIRIDSEYHGAECVISDYLTDLGIQVAVVYDEKDKKPVAAAWLWVGKEKTTGEVSLVIDNIEANTDYTSRYSEVIGKKLREYIKSYAKVIGTDSIIQGAQNNDLVIADLVESKKFKKIGGYNRAGGYYLEAESDD